MGKRKCASKYRSSTPDRESPTHRDSSPASDLRREASGSSNRAANLPSSDNPAVIRSTKPFEVSNSPDNIHSPYFLHSSDHPGLVLASEALDGTNYSIWTIAMTTSLEAKNKLGFIDGSIAMPVDTDPFYKIWCRCNSMVKSWLLNSVSKQIYTSVLYFKAASDIWNDLHTRFHKSNLPRLYKLRHQLHSLRQGSMDLSSYHTKTQSLWEELNSLNAPAHTIEGLMAQNESNRVIDFLMGLNDSYDHIRSQILMKKSLPSLSEVFNILDQEDSQRSARTTSQTSVDASTFQVSSYGKPRPVCTHCKGVGHVVDRCYKIHGYPPGLKARGRTYPPKNTASQHGQASANAIISESPDVKQSTSVTANATSPIPSTLSSEQLQQFIAYFSAQLQDQSHTSTSNGLLPSPSAVSEACKATGSYTGVDDWQG
ncbi:uncharacterized protein LOC130512672 [Raphanus sativus]|uniref:Uncharacterized protein LOC130501377 n=1 Tax=Raphanus sativus TaxID=3726 RepID=A0A9W3CKZ7_RAPSA|nr:uncharacterized protein LOC130501377 [Raphanus sativus]XP_056853252.1 uncharacterized protein LOC130502474 [Raphanus sativus]XP_056866866.1 uncharacterized protein LOC130512672 [Raphanus sativus]